MRTISMINKEISELSEELIQLKKMLNKERQMRKAAKAISFRRFCIKYLEYKPNKEFLESEYRRLSATVERIRSEAKRFVAAPESKAVFLKEQDYLKHNTQFKTLEFLLKK